MTFISVILVTSSRLHVIESISSLFMLSLFIYPSVYGYLALAERKAKHLPSRLLTPVYSQAPFIDPQDSILQKI